MRPARLLRVAAAELAAISRHENAADPRVRVGQSDGLGRELRGDKKRPGICWHFGQNMGSGVVEVVTGSWPLVGHCELVVERLPP